KTYFKEHPDIHAVESKIALLPILEAEYSTLSRAVHGSAAGFRMTGGEASPKLFKGTVADLGKWITREKAAISAINLLLIALFKDQITGAKALPLRRVLRLAL